ncbi:MAG: LytTR family DNA-binding domain-containing protein [Bacteroidales bacterium]|jgi:DNA-binding LytR/AlgR family response regulator|nr:LytTR family DNA-binding domain-containing protein [Bacteroidales bacterium]
MNCIIIDDDSFVRKITEDFIKQTEGLQLLCSFSNAVDAIKVLNINNSIDLILLDIEMPEMSGIDFLNALTQLPQIIIISSKEKYAINAFDYDVTDYLLKPFTYTRFRKAIDKVRAKQEVNRIHSKGDEIFIKHNSCLVKLKYADILWVEAMENYVIFNTFTDKYTIHSTMKAIEAKLPADRFARTHRSFIVNTGCILSIEDNTINIKTRDNINNIAIGKSYRDNLLGRLNFIMR